MTSDKLRRIETVNFSNFAMALSWIQRVLSRFRRTQKAPDHAPRISIVRNGIVATYGFIESSPLPFDDRSQEASIIGAQRYLEHSRERLANGGVRVEAPRVLRVPGRLRPQPPEPFIDKQDESGEQCVLTVILGVIGVTNLSSREWERTMDRAIKQLEKVNEIVARVTEDNIKLSKEMEENLAVLTLSCCKVLATIGKGVIVDE
ncbi:hypothetical protein EDD37DRAFT_9439 [Exophiala viscosa]|uniref:Uncharacterized protein n=1 Tax=Exophiala viscosa TaxID=2486360 RepID=A0AAN6DJS2_9EURO|nr:hypothetical protein EDD36DRAFT_112073 [Exophiala viscosa]KAI1628472.1 hypothetical protein EDD37DRAFT_9439 [Exophiala viscosa]